MRLWQTATAGLAIGCLTMGAAAQFDAEEGQQDDAAEQQIEQDQQAFGEEAEREGELRIGTVDLEAVSEAYERHQRERGDDRDADRDAGLGADAAQQDDDAGLQEPAQAEDAEPFGEGRRGQEQRDDAGIDPEMLDTIKQKAREAAEEEGVQMVVLEVLHEEGGNVNTIDLTDRVIERLEAGDEDEAEALMGIGEEDTDDADAEQDDDNDLAW